MTIPEANQTQSADPTRRLLIIAGRELLFDEEGFMWFPEDWTEGVAKALAAESHIKDLTDAHWRVLRFLREFFLHNGRAPLNRQLSKGTGLSLLQIERLFPRGIKHGARRLAGLPNPRTCT
jgi:tRNA 2-thiouridine synthesizing protein E